MGFIHKRFLFVISSPNQKESRIVSFSVRETSCLLQLVLGKTAPQTAQALGISGRTVEDHLIRIRKKVGCASKRELAELLLKNQFSKQYIELGLIDVKQAREDKQLIAQLIESVEKNDQASLVRCLQQGANPNGYLDPRRLRPLHIAAHKGLYESAKLLIQMGANPLARTSAGETPIDFVDSQKQPSLLKLLLEHGAKRSNRN